MSDCVLSRFSVFRPGDWADTQVRPYISNPMDRDFFNNPKRGSTYLLALPKSRHPCIIAKT